MHEHPRTGFVGSLKQPGRTARRLGYRMPAEFEPIDCVWLTLPHDPQTWPGCLEQAQRQAQDLLAALRQFVLITTTQELNISTDDSWIRDYGPIFVLNHRGELACHDFIFNGWGEKYEPYEHDDVVPQHVAAHAQIPIWIHNVVLEGGSIEVNGRGTVMTTEQCLLNVNRNPHLSRDEIIHTLHEALGTWHVIWLPGGIEADDTDGHIDNVARFIRPGTVVAPRALRNHPDHRVLELNWQVLKHARDEKGHRLHLIELPTPRPIYYDYPRTESRPGGRQLIPASYANFLIANSGVFVPTFGQPTDDEALRTLERAMPDHHVVPVRCEHLAVGLGTIHCLTLQQPRG